jgi:hypothetical protein
VEGIEESVGGDEDNGERGSQGVLVIPFTPNIGDRVGLIAEQKVWMTTVTLILTKLLKDQLIYYLIFCKFIVVRR